MSYYGKFLPQLANRLAPLYKRLQKDSQWKWGSDEQQAFDMVKEELTAPCLLVHFDQDRDLVLTCDASLYGVGAVISNRVDDGTDNRIDILFTCTSGEKLCSIGQGSPGYCIWGKKFHVFSIVVVHHLLGKQALASSLNEHMAGQPWLQKEFRGGH